MSDDLEHSGQIDEIVDREQRGEASPAESRQIAEWRRASLANEHEYRRLVRLLSVAGTLTKSASEAPSAAGLLARQRPRVETPIKSTRRWSTWLIPAAAAAGLAAGIIVPRRSAPLLPKTLGIADIATGAAEMTTVQLGDGSVVRLAPASRLHVNPSDSAREVTLDGKAFFVVAKMPDRPFVVHTAAGNARVLGTRFELSSRERDLNLVVVEGRVALSAGTTNVEVRGGEQSGVRNEQALAPTPVTNADRMAQWVGKFLVFQATPVRDAAREIERVYGLRVVVADSVLARRTVSATFTDQTTTQVFDVLCQIVSAKCESRSNEVVMTRR